MSETQGTYVDPPILHVLRQFEQAYPEDVFPTPPPEHRAKDAAAADVMRNLALPTMKRAADHIEYLQRTIVDAVNVLCPAIEGNTEDVEADMDTGYRILRAAVENLADYD